MSAPKKKKGTKKTSKTVWVATASSESGDDYGPYTFRKKPTKAEIEEFWREECPGDCAGNDGPGDWGTYLYTRLEECTVI